MSHLGRGDVTGADIFILWQDVDLREYIVDVSYGYTHDPQLFKCLIAKAWEVLSVTYPGRTDLYYRRVASRIIKKEYDLYRFHEKVLTQRPKMAQNA